MSLFSQIIAAETSVNTIRNNESRNQAFAQYAGTIDNSLALKLTEAKVARDSLILRSTILTPQNEGPKVQTSFSNTCTTTFKCM